jgi:hypothetical protein
MAAQQNRVRTWTQLRGVKSAGIGERVATYGTCRLRRSRNDPRFFAARPTKNGGEIKYERLPIS